MHPIALRATLTVDPSSPNPFVTGAGALLYINGYPSWILAPLVPISLFPLYVVDPTAFIDSISSLTLAAEQSVSFIYGTLIPQGPVALGTYAAPGRARISSTTETALSSLRPTAIPSWEPALRRLARLPCRPTPRPS